jgi:predicted small integral membrane protein
MGANVLAGRITKVVMVLSVALFALLVAFDNVYDYGANFAFVRHVLSMDTTFLDPSLMGRAITDPMLWHLSYAAIILGGLGFLVWFFGFMVVGGEWFAMWQSKLWNGQEAAFRFYVTLLGVLIFVGQEDPELDAR